MAYFVSYIYQGSILTRKWIQQNIVEIAYRLDLRSKNWTLLPVNAPPDTNIPSVPANSIIRQEWPYLKVRRYIKCIVVSNLVCVIKHEFLCILWVLYLTLDEVSFQDVPIYQTLCLITQPSPTHHFDCNLQWSALPFCWPELHKS